MLALPFRRLVLLSFLALAPALAMLAIGSSMWWAPGNPVYGALDQAMSNAQFKALFNLFSPILILAGIGLAVILNVWPTVKRRSLAQLSPVNILIIASATILFAILMAYVTAENWYCIIGVDTTC